MQNMKKANKKIISLATLIAVMVVTIILCCLGIDDNVIKGVTIIGSIIAFLPVAFMSITGELKETAYDWILAALPVLLFIDADYVQDVTTRRVVGFVIEIVFVCFFAYSIRKD